MRRTTPLGCSRSTRAIATAGSAGGRETTKVSLVPLGGGAEALGLSASHASTPETQGCRRRASATAGVDGGGRGDEDGVVDHIGVGEGGREALGTSVHALEPSLRHRALPSSEDRVVRDTAWMFA